MTEIGSKIKQLRTELGLTLEQVGQMVGVSKSTVRKWETGAIENMGRDKIALLAKALKVSPIYLMGWENEGFIDSEKEMANYFGISKAGLVERRQHKEEKSLDELIEKIGGVPYNPTHRIPILGYISAGLPLYAEEHIEGYTYTELNGGNEYFALRVKGDSMNAVNICPGSLVIVRRQPIVENGEIAVVMVDGENATVKRFYRNDNTITLMPQSTNPSHIPQIYNLKETEIKIIGKVIECTTKFE